MSEAVSREAQKLRLVLDYLPCEPCLAVKVPDQELYCSLCRRLSRTVAQKVIVPVDVLVEAPAPPEPEPIIVPPPVEVMAPPVPLEATLETIEPAAPSVWDGIEPAAAPAFAEPEPVPAGPAYEDSTEIEAALQEAYEIPPPAPEDVLIAQADVAAPTSEELEAYTAEPTPPPVEDVVEEEEEEDLFGISMAAVDDEDLYGYAPKPRESIPELDLNALNLELQTPAAEEAEPAAPAPPPALDEGDFVIEPSSLENRAPEAEEEEFLLEGFEPEPVEPAPAPEETEAFEQENLPPPIEALPELDALTAPVAAEETPWPEEQQPVVEDLGFVEEPAPEQPAQADPAVQDLWSEEPVEPANAWAEAHAAPAEPEALWTEEPVQETFSEVEEVVDFEILPDDEEEGVVPVAAPEPSGQETTWAEEAVEAAPAEPPMMAAPEEEAPLASEDAATNVKLLDGVGPANRRKLRDVGIQTLGELAARDPQEVAQRSGIPLRDTQRWKHVADLTLNAGIPLEYSEALAATGVAGVEGLREMPEEEVAARLSATSHRPVTRGMVASWKRRV